MEEPVDILFSLDYPVGMPLELLEIIPLVGEDGPVNAMLILPLLPVIHYYGLSTNSVGMFCQHDWLGSDSHLKSVSTNPLSPGQRQEGL